jgi:hypothetical protein
MVEPGVGQAVVAEHRRFNSVRLHKFVAERPIRGEQASVYIHTANFRIEKFGRARNHLVVPPEDLHVALYEMYIFEAFTRS